MKTENRGSRTRDARSHGVFKLPFGEELYAGVSSRTAQQGYTSDSVRQKFTGYEADGEAGLNFAQARYHSSTQGRFTSADPTMLSVDIGAPQSLNRYSYTMNDPLDFIDPSGMFSEFDFQEGQGQEPTVSAADLMNPDNFRNSVIHIYTNVWQSTGMPLTELEVALNRPLRSLTEGRLSSQRGFMFDSRTSGDDRAMSGALNLAGAAGTFGSRYMYQEGGFWRGLNGVANTQMIGQGPNQYTGARSLAIEKAGALGRFGQVAGIAGYSLSGIQTIRALRQGGLQEGIKPGTDTAFGIAGTHGGLWGAGAAGIYFLVDMTIGWERAAGCDANCQYRADHYGMFAK